MGTTNTPARPDRANYLEVSPYEADGGNLIGKSPRSVSKADLLALGHPTSPIKAIRRKCLDCAGEQPSEVRKCTAVNCALWPFRMGVSPFHGLSAASKSEAANSEGF